MATFGTWPAQDAKRWDLVIRGADTIRATNRTLKIINYAVGWIQPIAFLAYRRYAISQDFYVDALLAKCFAHAPEMFIGRTIHVKFFIQRIEHQGTEIWLRNGRTIVITDKEPETLVVMVDGRVHQRDGITVIVAGSVRSVNQ